MNVNEPSSTLDALDWPVIRDALTQYCETTQGIELAQKDTFAESPRESQQWFEEVKEIWSLDDVGERPPMGSIQDVNDRVYRATKGEILEPFDLVDIANSLTGMYALKQWILNRSEPFPCLNALAEPIDIDVFLLRNLEDSFTATGELDPDYYPELKTIRDRMEQLREHGRTLLNQLLSDVNMSNAFHDRYITDRGGRMVIPVRVQARK